MKWCFILIVLCGANFAHAGSVSLWDKVEKPTKVEEDFDFLLDEGESKSSKEDGEFTLSAEVLVLDRRLGKVSKPITITTEKAVTYADMSILLKKCWRNKEESWDRDARALLEVKQASEINVWIFSKFPSLSQYKNERYDILLRQCK